jgi:DNA-binding MarR family transcriptional regulator
MTVRDTSLEAFRLNQAAGIYETQQTAVAACVVMLGSATRRELATRTRFEIGSVTGAVNALIKRNILWDPKVVTCKTTKRPVHLVERVPCGPTQTDLFA